jgi:non-specific serine/threonine protein kinase
MGHGEASSFAALLRRHREAAGLSQEALAERAGLSADGISALERGARRAPQRETVRRLARGLGLTAEAAAALEGAVRRTRGPGRPAGAATGGVPGAGTHPRPAPASEGAAARAHNLPLQLTSFVGRERELAAVPELLRRHRLVTLTGPGGAGKTRLALRVAAAVLAGYPDGAWLADLAALADSATVVPAVADAVGVREEPGRSLDTALAEALGPKRLLLVLDNCEHLLDPCARLADPLLRACPHLRVLATSRTPLGVDGEAVWRVAPLGLPRPAAGGAPPPAAGLLRSEAGRLFAERAAAAQPGFAVTDRNAPAVAAICARLDGLPLALELAAARVRTLPVDELLTRLEDRFRLLTGGGRTAPPRRQTLRAAVDWSYDLLSADERSLFGRLAVFAGGFALDAAEAVGAGGGIAPEAVLDLLARLVDQSLVVLDAAPAGGGRYRLLETLRQYARERLVAAGEAPAAQARHLAHFLALAERADAALYGPAAPDWIDRLDAEHDNLRAALEWSLADGSGPDRAALGLRLAAALGYFWFLRLHRREGHAWLERALARAGGVPGPARATALYLSGILAVVGGGDLRLGLARLAESAARHRRLGDAVGTARALGVLGNLTGAAGDHARARAHCDEALALARAAGERRTLAWVLGQAAYTRGVFDEATRHRLASESAALAADLGDLMATALASRSLGEVAQRRGDLAGAADAFAADLAAVRALKDTLGIVVALQNLGDVAWAQGDAPRAAARYEAALAVCRAHGTVFRRYARFGLAVLRGGDPGRAGALLAEGLVRHHARGDGRGAAQCAAGLAAVALARRQPLAAARLFGAATALSAAAGFALEPSEQAELDRGVATARAQLDEDAFAAAWAAGRASAPDQLLSQFPEGEGAPGGGVAAGP